jgi:hypothetical protein
MACIKSLQDDNKTWCGKNIEMGEFYFKSVDAAVLNSLHPSRLMTCPQCTASVCEILHQGSYEL